MRNGLAVANEALAFLLELAALAALSYWGFTGPSGIAARVLLGIGAPVLAAVVWGLFAAPRARLRPPLAGVLAVKALVFGAAAVALYASGGHLLAIVFAIVVVANTALAMIYPSGLTTPAATRRSS